MVRLLNDDEARAMHKRNAVYVFVCRGCEDIMFTSVGSNECKMRMCSYCQKYVV